MHSSEFLRDAERHRVKGNGPDGKKSGEITGFDEDVFDVAIGGKYLFACSADKKVRQFEGKELIRKGEVDEGYEDEKKWGAYNMERLAVVASDGSGKPALVKAAADLDRGVSQPRFVSNGIQFLVTDDRSTYLARTGLTSDAHRRVRPAAAAYRLISPAGD